MQTSSPSSHRRVCFGEDEEEAEEGSWAVFKLSKERGSSILPLFICAAALYFFFFWEEGSDGLIVCSLVLNNEEE